MKKQIKSRKVQVRTETIRKLSEQQLESTGGGASPTKLQDTQQGYCFITH